MSEEIQVMVSLAMKAAYLKLAPRYELESGNRVATQFVGGVDIARRLRAGESADLVMMAAKGIDDLERERLVAAGSRIDLVRSIIGVAVRAGAARPDIGSSESLKRVLHAAKAIGYSSGPSGVYLAEVFKRWEISPAKLHQTAPGLPAGDLLVSGEAEIAFQQVSELLPVKGIDYIGPLPADLQLVTIFSAGTPVSAKNAGDARKLALFLKSPGAVPVLASYGLEPA